MRILTVSLAVALWAIASPAEARLFWQTYGSVTPAGAGCAWNMNQDYFVPRHCDTGRYDLFSPCKSAHTISAACRRLHPIYKGYCSPYGACRYRWRDHVYKTYCGCTPHRCTLGPWRDETCRKSCVLRHGKHAACVASGCQLNEPCGYRNPEWDGVAGYAAPTIAGDAPLAYVEPFGGELLGTVPAAAASSLGGGGGGLPAGGATVPASGATSQALQSLGISLPFGGSTAP